ncbi:MAG TPA: hypothetical protein VGG39_10400 [Polyangiaceae bacterium]|jgi:hypothetical protein
MVLRSSCLFAAPLLLLACSSSSKASPPGADASPSESDAAGEAASDGAGDASGGAATDAEAAHDAASDVEAGGDDPCAVYFAASTQSDTLAAACTGGATTDAGSRQALCEMELGSSACSASDRASFGNDAATLAGCVSALGPCAATNESSWGSSESACFASFGSALAVSSACSNALYIAGF